eukprot:TRINITY_DN806_c0_g1_i1.p1 TRINITY_DN806_c0_g1~~TRINITY_DN806_c0_g1_i1.p1  ORF type:complete len:456 (+),score=121.24 TRINITY_DN806_c0_g1_i1:1322-2689(+)
MSCMKGSSLQDAAESEGRDLLALPDELLLLLFEHVRPVDLVRLGCVNRRLAVLAVEECVWAHHVEALVCMSLQQIRKPPGRTWRQHWRRLATPPPPGSKPCNIWELFIEEQFDGAVCMDEFYFLSRGNQIHKYDAVSLHSPLRWLARIDVADTWKMVLSTVGRFLVAGLSVPHTGTCVFNDSLQRIAVFGKPTNIVMEVDSRFIAARFNGELVWCDSDPPVFAGVVLPGLLEPKPIVAGNSVGVLRLDGRAANVLDQAGDTLQLHTCNPIERSTDVVSFEIPASDMPAAVHLASLHGVGNNFIVLYYAKATHGVRFTVLEPASGRRTPVDLPPSEFRDLFSCAFGDGLFYVALRSARSLCVYAFNSAAKLLWRSEVPSTKECRIANIFSIRDGPTLLRLWVFAARAAALGNGPSGEAPTETIPAHPRHPAGSALQRERRTLCSALASGDTSVGPD